MMPDSPSGDPAARFRQAKRAGPRPRVLLIEDERDIAALIKHTLERGGDLEVAIAGSGAEGLKAAAQTLPDLIVLDLNLRILRGLDVCRLLRARAATRTVPIIMIAAPRGENGHQAMRFSARDLAARARAALHWRS